VPGWCGVTHGIAGATPSAQQVRQTVTARGDQFRIAELDDLPDAGRTFHCQRIGPGEQFRIGDAGQRARGNIHQQLIAIVEPVDRT